MKIIFSPFIRWSVLLLCMSCTSITHAATHLTSPIGKWTTIDEVTGATKAVVKIFQAKDGTLSGKVIETITHPDIPPPLKFCDKCSGDRKGQPIVGMIILWDMKQVDDHTWSGGTILDPKNGNEYSCKFTLLNDGNTLEVRGYIGISLLGRDQTWIRNKK